MAGVGHSTKFSYRANKLSSGPKRIVTAGEKGQQKASTDDSTWALLMHVKRGGRSHQFKNPYQLHGVSGDSREEAAF